MSTIVTYKDQEGKRRQKAVPISVFTEVNQTVREFIDMMRLPPHTYIYTVKQGGCTYVWKGPARDAFTEEQLLRHKYWT